MGKYLEGSGFGDAMREPCATYFFSSWFVCAKTPRQKGHKKCTQTKEYGPLISLFLSDLYSLSLLLSFSVLRAFSPNFMKSSWFLDFLSQIFFSAFKKVMNLQCSCKWWTSQINALGGKLVFKRSFK